MHVARLLHHLRGGRAAAAALVVAAAIAAPSSASAQGRTAVYWADWTSAETVDGGRGTVFGTMNVGGTAVGLRYEGELDFATTLPGGTAWFTPRDTYLGSLLSDGTPIGTDIVALSGYVSGTNRLVFDRPITNPVLSFFSLGRGSVPVSFAFDAPFELVAGGPGAFGGSAITQPSANVVRGTEGNGTIRFLGTYSSLAFTTAGAEYWSGFTVGVQGLPTASPPESVVPEPSTYAMLGLGLVAVGAAARRRRVAA